MLGATMHARQNLNWGQGEQVVSPEVNANKTVTFRMVAPMERTHLAKLAHIPLGVHTIVVQITKSM